jgi:hypothetical protein
MKAVLLIFALTFSTVPFALAQDPPVTPVIQPTDTISDDAFVQSTADAIKQIGEVTRKEGATKVTVVLTCILVISQLLIQLTKTNVFGRIFSKVDHAGKLAIVSCLTVLTTLVPLLQQGVSFSAALVSGGVLTAIMVAGHQVYLAFVNRKSTLRL